MSRTIRLALVAAFSAAAVLCGTAANAKATGRVVVFAHELTAATTFTDPEGCKRLPTGSHVLINLTDRPVKIYLDPICRTLSLTVKPGFGSHVSAVGSFRA